MEVPQITRRGFLLAGAAMAAGANGRAEPAPKPVVSVVRIKNDRVASAVEEAIDLLGGIQHVAKDKQTVMLKPNLVFSDAACTTKPEVVRTIAQLMLRAGKQVSIGEGSAGGPNFNIFGSQACRTRKREILDPMQKYVFDQLGYTELARTLRVPLVNLHSGDMAQTAVSGAFVFDKLTIHRSLAETDLLCSVPMMKTHTLAGVTLGMKNLIGVYPGTVYQAVRGYVHDVTSEVEPSGTAAAIVDMVRANKLGLVVVDGSTAMEGDGPVGGPLVKMDVIVAGTNPLAADMVAASLMGFEAREVPTFAWANKAGMRPASLDEIEVRGEPVERARRAFARPHIYSWKSIRGTWGWKEI
jgi:uncharacterized protein (DUF362 family)